MTRSRFRWTRAKYYQAYREARVYDGQGFMYHGEPSLVRRYRELWDRHPQGEDPLTRHISWRYPRTDPDGIPF